MKGMSCQNGYVESAKSCCQSTGFSSPMEAMMSGTREKLSLGQIFSLHDLWKLVFVFVSKLELKDLKCKSEVISEQ